MEGASADLALLSILGSGNDYLPGMRGVPREGGGGAKGLWARYLQLRSMPLWGP